MHPVYICILQTITAYDSSGKLSIMLKCWRDVLVSPADTVCAMSRDETRHLFDKFRQAGNMPRAQPSDPTKIVTNFEPERRET
jgi:hypothetical protein